MQRPEPIDIIIPTYDNFDQLTDCVQSMLMTGNDHPVNIIIVNNGQARIPMSFACGKVVDVEENLGWIGGLREGLKHSTSKYVLFANDDIFIPRASHKWLSRMTRDLDVYPNLGAVGPTSNVVMGNQNIWRVLPAPYYQAMFLIGFCILVRREALDKAGGVQDMEYGGDDIDLSIRLRKAGYGLAVNRTVFVYHHGFQTGNRVHGDHTKPNGWNSREMTDNTNTELIRKHGFLEWWNTLVNHAPEPLADNQGDAEKDAVLSFLNGERIIVECGCGAKKTVEKAIGVDIVPKGEISPFIGEASVADLVADVGKELPFEDASVDCIIARHVLEHIADPVRALTLWREKLVPGGKLIVSCPDERLSETIPMNPEHKHAYTPESFASLARLTGFRHAVISEGYNGVSFTACMEKA